MKLKSVISILGHREDEKEGNRDRQEPEAPGVKHRGLSSWLHHLPEPRHTTRVSWELVLAPETPFCKITSKESDAAKKMTNSFIGIRPDNSGPPDLTPAVAQTTVVPFGHCPLLLEQRLCTRQTAICSGA